MPELKQECDFYGLDFMEVPIHHTGRASRRQSVFYPLIKLINIFRQPSPEVPKATEMTKLTQEIYVKPKINDRIYVKSESYVRKLCKM